MASDKWDSVIAGYQNIYIYSREPENARGILNLIPRIKDDADFADVIPGTSHMSLTLQIPQKPGSISVICEKESEEYRICIQPRRAAREEWFNVRDEHIIDTLKRGVKMLLSNDDVA